MLKLEDDRVYPATAELQYHHVHCFKPQFNLDLIFGLVVPTGASLSDVELADLFDDGGLDRICVPAHDPGLLRLPAGDIDLLVFAYDGDPNTLGNHIHIPEWALGFVVSTMEEVAATHEENQAAGGPRYAISTSMICGDGINIVLPAEGLIVIPDNHTSSKSSHLSKVDT
jgi:hypothetical protein